MVAALALMALALPVAPASAEVSDQARSKAAGEGFNVREELGSDVSVGRGGRDDGLFRVKLEDGSVITTHGPDPREELEDHGTGIGPGDPERAPVCADTNTQRILYGVPAGATNRYGAVVPELRSIVRRMNAILNEESLASGGLGAADYRVLCDADGEIEVDWFVGPAAPSDSFENIIDAARQAGFDDASTKYSIFYDTPAVYYCGVGSLYDDDLLSAHNYNNGGGSYAITHNSCWQGGTPMHENGHNMGAVQSGAPNSTGSGYHCYDEIDVMCYSPDGGDRNQNGTVTRCREKEYFDCGYNDYFDAAPEQGEWLAGHWNIGSPINRFISFSPRNDNFAAAQALIGADAARTTDTNRNATKEAGEPNHAQNPGGASVWYRWTAPKDGPVTIDTQGSDFNTTLAVYSGDSVNALTEKASNDDAAQGTRSSELSFDASAGTTYRIAVDGFDQGWGPAKGTVKLRLAQSSVNGYEPIGYVRKGDVYSARGAVSRLYSDDGRRLEINAVEDGNNHVSAILPYAVIGEQRSSLEKLTIDYDGNATGSSTSLAAAVYNFSTEEFELLDDPSQGVNSDRAIRWSDSSSPADYVSPAGAVVALVAGVGSQPLRTRTDLVHFEVEYRESTSTSATREPVAASSSRTAEVVRRRAARLLKSDVGGSELRCEALSRNVC